MKAIFNVPGANGGRSELRDADTPVPAERQVLVKVAASAINRGELTGLRAARSGDASIGGLEFSGEVVETGPGVTHFQRGQRVMGQFKACQAEFVAIDERLVMPVPDGMDMLAAAAFPNCYVTAHNALVTNGGLRAGESVLVNAAPSGIGVAAVQIAAALGAGLVIASTRSPAKVDLVRQQGAHVVIDTSSQSLIDEIMGATGKKGVDLVIDCIGGTALADNLQALAIMGRLVNIGRLGPKEGTLDMELLAYKRAHVIGTTFRTRTLQDRYDCVQRCWQDLGALLAAGKLRPQVDHVFEAARIGEAQAAMDDAAHFGKVVVTF